MFSENGIHMFLWFGLGVSPDLIQKLFGAPSATQVDVDRICLPELDNPVSIAIRSIIDAVRIQRHRCMRVSLNIIYCLRSQSYFNYSFLLIQLIMLGKPGERYSVAVFLEHIVTNAFKRTNSRDTTYCFSSNFRLI